MEVSFNLSGNTRGFLPPVILYQGYGGVEEPVVHVESGPNRRPVFDLVWILRLSLFCWFSVFNALLMGLVLLLMLSWKNCKPYGWKLSSTYLQYGNGDCF